MGRLYNQHAYIYCCNSKMCCFKKEKTKCSQIHTVHATFSRLIPRKSLKEKTNLVVWTYRKQPVLDHVSCLSITQTSTFIHLYIIFLLVWYDSITSHSHHWCSFATSYFLWSDDSGLRKSKDRHWSQSSYCPADSSRFA